MRIKGITAAVYCVLFGTLGVLAQQTVTTSGDTANVVPKFLGTGAVLNSDFSETNGKVSIATPIFLGVLPITPANSPVLSNNLSGSDWSYGATTPNSTDCGTGTCIVSAPTGDQTITGPLGGNQYFIMSNCSNCFTLKNDVAAPLTGIYHVNQMGYFSQNVHGPGNHVGFPYCNSTQSTLCPPDNGETTNAGFYQEDYSRRIGISQTWDVRWSPKHAGDSAWTYIYGDVRAAWNSGGSEGTNVIAVNGTGAKRYPFGIVMSTTGLGDTAPVFSFSDFAPGSFVVDTQSSLAAGTLTGMSNMHYGSTFLYSMPVSNTLTPSTVCSTNTYVPLTQPLGSFTSITLSCTLIQGTLFTTGYAWLVSPSVSVEMVKVMTAAGTGATQMVTVLATKPHETGSLLIQGGTHGFISLDLDASSQGGGSGNAQGWRTTHFAFGATDASHYICGKVLGGLWSACPPYPGYEQSVVGAPYHLYSGAEVLSADADGGNPKLAQNDVAWVAGDSAENPPYVSYLERTILVEASVRTPSIPGSGAALVSVGANGEGITAAYSILETRNDSSNSWENRGGNISPPNGHTMKGAAAATLMFDQPTGASQGDNCGIVGAVLCMRGNGYSDKVDIFRMTDYNTSFGYDRSANHWYYHSRVALDDGLQMLNPYGGTFYFLPVISSAPTLGGAIGGYYSGFQLATSDVEGSTNPQWLVNAANQVGKQGVGHSNLWVDANGALGGFHNTLDGPTGAANLVSLQLGGGPAITSTALIPVVGTAAVGQVLCMYAAPVGGQQSIGHCTSAVSISGGCTCVQ